MLTSTSADAMVEWWGSYLPPMFRHLALHHDALMAWQCLSMVDSKVMN